MKMITLQTLSRMCLLVAFFVASVSCETELTRRNNPEDATRARESAGVFYQLIAAHQLDSASKYFGPTVGKEDGLKILQSASAMRGSLVDAVPVLIETIVTTWNGEVTGVVCNFKVDATYSGGKTEELVNMSGESFETLKIIGFNVALK